MTACSGVVLSHDEDAAAKSALDFARVAFIDHDARTAYPLISEEARKNVPPEQFSEILAKQHPAGYPATITASQFEPIPGQKALSIILVGENATEKFYYRLIMVGTAPTGYTVGGFLRGNGPYTGNPQMHGAKLLQPLKAGYTISGEKPSTKS
jgi:hypothetical protein